MVSGPQGLFVLDLLKIFSGPIQPYGHPFSPKPFFFRKMRKQAVKGWLLKKEAYCTIREEKFIYIARITPIHFPALKAKIFLNTTNLFI